MKNFEALVRPLLNPPLSIHLILNSALIILYYFPYYLMSHTLSQYSIGGRGGVRFYATPTPVSNVLNSCSTSEAPKLHSDVYRLGF